jgi:hypothetical protein
MSRRIARYCSITRVATSGRIDNLCIRTSTCASTLARAFPVPPSPTACHLVMSVPCNAVRPHAAAQDNTGRSPMYRGADTAVFRQRTAEPP